MSPTESLGLKEAERGGSTAGICNLPGLFPFCPQRFAIYLLTAEQKEKSIAIVLCGWPAREFRLSHPLKTFFFYSKSHSSPKPKGGIPDSEHLLWTMSLTDTRCLHLQWSY